MAAVQVRGLVKAFGAVRAVDRVSFDVAAGSVLTLLGPSGCGKTTLLRCVAGLETPDAGEISIAGRPVFREGDGVLVPAERRNLGMVFQSYAIWPHMTVAENVAFGLRVRRRPAAEIRRAVEEALALVRLEGLGKRLPSQLSGGQMQRVVLARCLAYRPELLLLDEPLANLDTRLRIEMRAELRRIQRETGTTMIAVTHDQAEALSLSDRVLVMAAGRVVQAGTPQEIYGGPRVPFVAAFLGSANVLDGHVRSPSAIVADGVGEIEVETGLPAGTAVRICCHPAHVSLRRAARAATAPTGRVAARLYLGETVEYRVQCGSREISVAVPSAGEQVGDGDTVELVFDPARLHVFPLADGP